MKIRTSPVLLASATALASFIASTAHAADGTWTGGNVNGNWSDATKWQDSIIGDGAGSTVTITTDWDGTGGGAHTVSLQGVSRTVGILNFGDDDGNNGKISLISSGGTLTFDNSGAGAQFNYAGGFNSGILVNSILSDDLAINIQGNGNLLVWAGTMTGAAGNHTISNVSTGTTTYRVQGIISDGAGTVGLTQNSATSDTLFYSGAHTYSGTTTITAGSLILNANNLMSDSSDVLLNGGSLNIANSSDTVGAVTLESGSITGTTGVLTGSSYALESGTISAILAGSGDLTKSTAGTVTLSGSNTYTGSTTVSGGTLQAGSAQAFGVNSNTTVNAPGILLLDGNSTTLGSLSGDGSVVNDNDSATAATITLGGGNATGGDFSGDISDGTGGGALSLDKIGTGTQILSGANTYTGATTVSAGTLDVTGSLTSAVTVNDGSTIGGNGSTTGLLTLGDGSGTGAVLDVANTSGFTSNGLTTNVTGGNVAVNLRGDAVGTVDILTYGGGTFTGATTDFTVNNLGGHGASIGTVADSGTAISVVTGRADNTWIGTTDSTWEVGGAKSNWTNSYADGVYQDNDKVTFGDTGVGTIALQGSVATDSVIFENTSGNNYIFNDLALNDQTLSASNGISVTGDGNVTLNVKVTGNTDIVHSGGGILVLGGTNVDNDFVGTITVDGGGTLRNGKTDANNLNSLGNFGNTFVFRNGSTFDITAGNNLDRGFKGYGTGSFVFEDGTTLTNSSNTTKRNAFDDELVFAGDVILEGGGRFDIAGNIDVTGTDITITMRNNAGNVIGGDNSDESIALWLVEDGTLFHNTALNLGDNADVRVKNGGVLRANGTDAWTISNDVFLEAGSVMEKRYTGGAVTYSGMIDVEGNSTFDLSSKTNSETWNFTGGLKGSGDLTINETGVIGLGSSLDASGYTGKMTFTDTGGKKQIHLVDAGANVTLSNDIAINETGGFDIYVADAGSTLTLSGDFDGNSGATNGIQKTGAGTTVLSGTNTNAGAMKIANGKLQLGDGGTTGSLTGIASISTSSASANLTINRSNAFTQATDLNGKAITGTGSFTQAGTGTTTLTAVNTYSGATNVEGGTLVVEGSGSINTTSGIVVSSGGTFDYNSSTALTAGLSFSGTGNTLTGSGTINTAVTITDGNILSVGNSPGTMNFASGLTLDAGSLTIAEIDGTAGAGVVGGHDFHNVTGALTYGGDLSLVLGTGTLDTGTYSWDLFDFGSESGTFASIVLSGDYTGSLLDADMNGVWDLVSGDNTWEFDEASGVLGLTVVPEPNAYALLAGLFGLAAVMFRRRRS